MKTIGNIIWILVCGVWLALGWILAGFLWSITIIGLPIGMQCFKMARLSFAPFGKEVLYGTGAMSFLVNVLWLIFGGLELALASALFGVLLCLTMIGIPFGKQCFKLAQLSLMPFGASVINSGQLRTLAVRR